MGAHHFGGQLYCTLQRRKRTIQLKAWHDEGCRRSINIVLALTLLDNVCGPGYVCLLLGRVLQSLLKELPEKQRQVMVLRYGLEDGQEMSLASISKRMDLSREQVRQLERQAMDYLRKRKTRMQEYLAS